MNPTTIALLYCPFPSHEAARAAAMQLLQTHHVACCNLLHGSEAHYWWEGQLHTRPETILIAKTTTALAETVSAALAALHPDTCPAILRLEAEAEPAFARWVHESTNL